VKGADANRAAANAFAANVLPVVRQIEASGVKGSSAIAAALNARGVRTARGGEWHATTVRNLLGGRLIDHFPLCLNPLIFDLRQN
jgi:hypothetical protein